MWRDTKNVRLLSTYVGTKPLGNNNISTDTLKVKRWNSREKSHIEINCPQIIKEYNAHMGGVDLMDGLMGRYHIRMRTTKWSNRIFYHLIDVALVNAYILYHRINPHNKIELPEFRNDIAESLCKAGSASGRRNVGRPSSSKLATKPKPSPKQYFPTQDVRYDQICHWCIFLKRGGKKQCKFSQCKKETQAFCVKCEINLCNSSTSSCFYDFHHK